MDTRKNIKVAPSVKAELNAIQKELGLKTESLTIGYLTAMYKVMKDRRISFSDHLEFMKEAEDANRQASI